MDKEARDDEVEGEADRQNEDEAASKDDDGSNDQERFVDDVEPTEGDQAEKKDEAETAKLVQLAVQAVMMSQRHAKEKKNVQKEASGAGSVPSKKQPTSETERKGRGRTLARVPIRQDPPL